MGYVLRVLSALRMGGLEFAFHKFEEKFFKSDNYRLYKYRIFESAAVEDYPKLVSLEYQMVTGKKININKPRSFNEKIQWMKVYDSTPIKTRLADKYLVREWIKDKIGEQYLVPILGVWDHFEDIDFGNLPDSFVLKCNHGSGWNLIVKNKADIDYNKAKMDFDKWIGTNFAFLEGEFQYRDIPPKIIAEQYLDVSGGIKDYRLYCFNGVPVQIWIDQYSGTPMHIRSIFDMNFNKLDFRCKWPDGGELLNEKPINFELMKQIAIKLSQEFAFVRIDFFEVGDRLYMGEMTFTPISGIGDFDPPKWDIILGEMLTLPEPTILPDYK
ncbi:MAG: glycosyltransferase [Lachnospiraceae bacterium]|nr:glycosyltransferase [Lachnospiraceae bacterium]